jgi:hypothetical protein
VLLPLPWCGYKLDSSMMHSPLISVRLALQVMHWQELDQQVIYTRSGLAHVVPMATRTCICCCPKLSARCSSTDDHNGALMQHPAQQEGSNWPDTFMPQ